MNFETFAPQRRGRAHLDSGPTIRLTTRLGSKPGGNLRISPDALLLIGIKPKQGDHHYFVLEVDREAGAIRLTPTEDLFIGRLMNPTNRQISLSNSFFEWTKWGASRWPVEVADGALYGAVRQQLFDESRTAGSDDA